VEWYDFAIFGALGIVLVPVFFPSEDGSSVLLAAFAVFATAFVARPLGAVVAGRRGDRFGRRTVLASVVIVMAAATAAIGLLPGHARIGATAGVAVVLLRATQGLAAGGEVGLAAVFIAEHAAPGRRGFVASWHTATLALGVAFGFASGALVLLAAPVDEEATWWRIPFLVAVPLGLVGLYVRRRVIDTPAFVNVRTSQPGAARPVREVWTEHRRALRAGFALTAAGSLAFNMWFVFLPNHLVDTTSRSLESALLTSVAGLVVAAGGALSLGRLSDRLGRRPVVLGSLAALCLAVVPLWTLATSGSLLGLAVAQSIVGTTVGGVLSIAWLAELFPTRVRATGLALTAGLATAALGGTAPLVGQVLVTTTGSATVPPIYVALVAAIALATLAAQPEPDSSRLD
jgi:MFS transporter, MHS family, proline/betaine transporter